MYGKFATKRPTERSFATPSRESAKRVEVLLSAPRRRKANYATSRAFARLVCVYACGSFSQKSFALQNIFGSPIIVIIVISVNKDTSSPQGELCDKSGVPRLVCFYACGSSSQKSFALQNIFGSPILFFFKKSLLLANLFWEPYFIPQIFCFTKSLREPYFFK